MPVEPKYVMSISLNVLNHLGINLYSKIPPVVAEAVANSYDADAENVWISISDDNIQILDDGNGMNLEDVNGKFLKVGYQRREHGEAQTPKFKRKVLGRKGIGKLSLFSIAEKVEVQSFRDGVVEGFEMDSQDIEQHISRESPQTEIAYRPAEVSKDRIIIDKDTRLAAVGHGTLITLRDLKKRTLTSSAFLRRRLARRFGVIGKKNGFMVYVDGDAVKITDRDYFSKLEYLAIYGGDEKEYLKNCNRNVLEKWEQRPNTIEIDGEKFSVTGWMGTVKQHGETIDYDSKDNLNNIVVMARGKVVQEDMLSDFQEAGVWASYLMGELEAGFLDSDDREDIVTSSRQNVQQHDLRYEKLKEWIFNELKHMEVLWTQVRDDAAVKEVEKVTPLKEWYQFLLPDYKEKARRMFGKINRMRLSREEKNELFKSSVLGFELYRIKENLSSFDRLQPEDFNALGKLFTNVDDVEAALYYQIVDTRLKVIDKLRQATNENAQEKIIQKHLFDHLWLLDPSWERGTDTARMEERVAKEFGGISAKLTPEEKRGRIDIRYKTYSGRHVIIELKRPNVRPTHQELSTQLEKYIVALRKLLVVAKREGEPYEAISILGGPCRNWKDNEKTRDEGIKALDAQHIRVVYYEELIQNSYKQYGEYLKSKEEASRISRLLSKIESSIHE